jgi:membrane-bound serine protease (ClpP class)
LVGVIAASPSVLFHLRRLICALALGLGLLGLGGLAGAQSERSVVLAPVKGVINPVQAGYISRVIDQAEQAGAAAVVLQLDTPGGLDGSMRQIIQRMLASRVPIIVYVAPPGGRAGSAGAYITYAGHVAAMAPNTNLGSATPVQVGEGGEVRLSDEMRAKVTNDAVAYIKSLAEQRGRNAEWAERAVRQGENVTASEAAQLGVVDFVADDLASLLQQADGRTVQLSGGPVVLETAGAQIEPTQPSAIEGFLHAISDPTIAYILLSLGSLGLMLELYNPGSFLPGIVGGVCLLLAFYALGTLPVNLAGLLLLAFGLLLFVADVVSPTHGILTAGGLISFVLGSLMLFNAPDSAPYLQLSLPVVAAVALTVLGFSVVAVGSLARVRRKPVVTGREGLIGAPGLARTRLAPTGMVLVESELWQARTAGRSIEPGESVRVESLDGLVLTVRPESEQPAQPAATSSTIHPI